MTIGTSRKDYYDYEVVSYLKKEYEQTLSIAKSIENWLLIFLSQTPLDFLDNYNSVPAILEEKLFQLMLEK